MFSRKIPRAVNCYSVSSGRKCSQLNNPVAPSYPSEAGFVRKSPYKSITIPNMTIDQYVWRNMRNWDSKIATVRQL